MSIKMLLLYFLFLYVYKTYRFLIGMIVTLDTVHANAALCFFRKRDNLAKLRIDPRLQKIAGVST